MNLVASAVGNFSRAVAAVSGPRLSTLIFHRVLPAADPLLPGEPDAEQFESRMRWLASAFRVLPLVEAARRLRDGSLPPNAACITFDDGYADNLTVAAPILTRLRLPATFFIATGFLDGGRMWNDTVIESIRHHREATLDLGDFGLGAWPVETDDERVAAIAGILDQLKYLPQDERQTKVDAIARRVGLSERSELMLTRAQLRELRRHGMSIGAHTISHPILTKLTTEAARAEIEEGKRDLEDTLGERVRVFAYPNGKPMRDYDALHVAIVKSLGFDAAVSTAWGVSDRRCDRFQLRRFTPWDQSLNRFGLRLAHNLMRRDDLAPAPVDAYRRAS